MWILFRLGRNCAGSWIEYSNYVIFVHHWLPYEYLPRRFCWLMVLRWHWNPLNLFLTEPLMCLYDFWKILVFPHSHFASCERERDAQESAMYFNHRIVPSDFFSQDRTTKNLVFQWLDESQCHSVHIKLTDFKSLSQTVLWCYTQV